MSAPVDFSNLEGDALLEAESEFYDRWAHAAAYYWAMAYIALSDRDLPAAREHARLAREAGYKTSYEGRLMAGIFGMGLAAPENPASIGATLPAAEVKAARAAVCEAIKPDNSAQHTRRRRA